MAVQITGREAFELHRELDVASKTEETVRLATVIKVLASGILAVIRRIPELLVPLFEAEKQAVVNWAERAVETEEVSDRDFVFHMLVSCGVDGSTILGLLERHKTFSKHALERITELLSHHGELQGRTDAYLKEVAEALIREDRVQSRDRGRHMLMTVAQTWTEWQELAQRFSVAEVTDLRQRVLYRFLEECRDPGALTTLAENVTRWCMAELNRSIVCETWEATMMHWVISCLEKMGRNEALQAAAVSFQSRFGNAMPRSVRFRIQSFLPVTPRRHDVDVAARITEPLKKEPEPRTLDQAIAWGWMVHKKNGRQVILAKGGRFITRYAQNQNTFKQHASSV